MSHIGTLGILQQTNMNSPYNKQSITYTDQRIQQIKKKYDTPIRKIRKDDKQNIIYDRLQKSFNKQLQIIEDKEKKIKNQFFGQNINKNILTKDNRCIEINKFRNENQLDHQQLLKYQNIQSKSTLISKIRSNQTDHNFFKNNQQTSQYFRSIRTKHSYNKLNRREIYDPRIQNIDKINSKIKRIFQCIDNCQKQELNQNNIQFSKVQPILNYSNSGLQRSFNSNFDKKSQSPIQLQSTNILERKKNSRDLNNNTKSCSKDRIMTEIPTLSQMKSSHSNNQFSRYLTEYKNRLKEQQNQVLLRSRVQTQKNPIRSASCYDKLRKSVNKDDEQIEDKSNKMDQINNEIAKFQQKITELQQQKRKLNIRFKPFYYQSSPIHKLKTTIYSQYSNKNQTKSNSQIIKQNASILLQQKSKLNQVNISQFQKNDQQRLSYQISQNNTKDNDSRNYDNIELRKKIGQRMQQRRKRIQMFQSEANSKNLIETRSLIQALCQQVKLDENMRNAKNWFSECSNLAKLKLLQNELFKRGANLSFQQIGEIFNNIREQQSDPFFSFREQKYTIQIVADSFIQCQRHWKQYILHKWNRDLLLAENFNSNFKENQIKIEDIVRLLNTQTGNFYRNRDLFLIYSRIQKSLLLKQNISLQNLIEYLT